MVETATDSSSSSNPNPLVFNAAGKVAENLILYFAYADYYMTRNDLKNWWIYLDLAYMQVDFSLKETDRTNLQDMWKKINPNIKADYGKLKEYHLGLRRLCKKFFTMGEGQTGPAIWRR